MKNKITFLNIIELLIIIYIIIFKTIIYKSMLNIYNLINILFWLALSIITYIKYHYPSNRSYIESNTRRNIIIYLLFYLVINFGLGFITGFSINPLTTSILNIIKTLPILFITILLQEYIRYIICKNSTKLNNIIIITIIYSVLDIIMQINSNTFYNGETILNFIYTIVIISIAKQCVFSYLTYKVSNKSTILLKSILELYPYIIPILPQTGDFLYTSILLIILFLIYYSTSNNLISIEKNTEINNVSTKILLIPIMIIIIVIIVLTSGVLKYQLVTIGSNSMKGEYSRGDAIVFQKIDDLSELKEGMILVFNYNNITITHRIINIEEDNGNYTFTTKGDNNETEDGYHATNKDVRGYVIYKIPYIGYPTILLHEALYGKYGG